MDFVFRRCTYHGYSIPMYRCLNQNHLVDPQSSLRQASRLRVVRYVQERVNPQVHLHIAPYHGLRIVAVRHILRLEGLRLRLGRWRRFP